MKSRKIKYIEDEFKIDDYYIIYINIDNNYNIYDELSYSNQLELKEDIYNYIDKKTELFSSNLKLKLCFVGRKISEEEQIKIISLIKEHYYVKEVSIKDKLSELYKRFIFYMVLGILINIIIIFLSNIFKDLVIIELTSLFGYIILWKAIEMIVFDRVKLIKELNRVKLNINQEIEFK